MTAVLYLWVEKGIQPGVPYSPFVAHPAKIVG
jgi:hypothetical protein